MTTGITGALVYGRGARSAANAQVASIEATAAIPIEIRVMAVPRNQYLKKKPFETFKTIRIREIRVCHAKATTWLIRRATPA
jgi:hypothetical protein